MSGNRAPVLSIAIATRNSERTVSCALASARHAARVAQLPYEFVVVDDASTDATRELIEQFRLADRGSVRCIHRPATRGSADAWNHAFAHCSGRFVAVLEATDEFHPEKLACCYRALAGGEVELVTHDWIDDRGARVSAPSSFDRHMDGPAPARRPPFDLSPIGTWAFRNGVVRFSGHVPPGLEGYEWLWRHDARIRRRHLATPLGRHVDPIGGRAEPLRRQWHAELDRRARGGNHAPDWNAPTIWLCAACGRLTLGATRCCGLATGPAPLLPGAVVEGAENRRFLPMSPPRLSLILAHDEEVDVARATVEGFTGGRRISAVELVVVDHGTSNRLVEAARAWSERLPVFLVAKSPSMGRDSAFDQAASVARGANLLFAAGGAHLVQAPPIAAIESALGDPRVGVAGFVSAADDPATGPRWDPDGAPYLLRRVPIASPLWAIRREVYWEFGGLQDFGLPDEQVPVDRSTRALASGYDVALLHGTVIHHGRIPPRIEGSWPSPELTCVVVSSDQGSALRDVLRAAGEDPRLLDGRLQVVVVDSASTDDTPLAIAEYRRRFPAAIAEIRLDRRTPVDDAASIGRRRAIGRGVATIPLPARRSYRLPAVGDAGPARSSDAASMGRWEVQPTGCDAFPVHAALLHTGEVLYFGGSENSDKQNVANDINHTNIWDPRTGRTRSLPSPSHDLFCVGHAFLADGRLLVAGGTQDYGTQDECPAPGRPPAGDPPGGLREVCLFDPDAGRPEEAWLAMPPMNPDRDRSTGGGRWYPTLVTLADGRVFMAGGLPRKPFRNRTNEMIERFDPNAGPRGRWYDMGDRRGMPWYYPLMHLLPDGQVLCVSTIESQTMKWNPRSGEWSAVAGSSGPQFQPITDGDPTLSFSTSALLPLHPPHYQTRILLAGQSVSRLLDLGPRGRAVGRSWIDTGPRSLPARTGRHTANPPRIECNLLLLPDGTLFVSGGTVDNQDAHAVLDAELYDPTTDRWQTLGSAAVPRGYHSLALLLPDGRIWTAGSNYNRLSGPENREYRVEIFSPPYLFRGLRPTIDDAPTEIRTGESFFIHSPHAARIRSVSLIRCTSVTHGFSIDQRYVGLAIDGRTAAYLRVAAPPDTQVAPPGYYMLFLLDDQGVPSIGRFVHIR